MNIYVRKLKSEAPSMIYWTIAFILLLLMFMLLYPAISQDIAAFESLLGNFPPELSAALGLIELDLADILGYYGFTFVYILLTGSIYSMKTSISVISEEVRSKTADFLLSKPVTRTTVVNAKILMVITLLLIQNIFYNIASFIIIAAYSPGQFSDITLLLINLSLFQVQLFFLAAGSFLAVVINRIKTVLPMSLGVVFFFFIMQMINQSVDDPKLAYISPFAYFDVSKIIQDVSYNITFLVINLILIFVLTGLAYILYQRKDIAAV